MQKELQDNGHSYSRQQIKDSLEGLTKTNITKSIKERTFCLFNYEKLMSYKTVTAAHQFHKRMAHHYTQVSLSEYYTILLTTIIRDFGLTRRKQLKDNLQDNLREKDFVFLQGYCQKFIQEFFEKLKQ